MIANYEQKTDFCPFPAYKDREKWDNVSTEIKEHYLTAARALVGREWPSLPATYYMDYARNGNRSRYEALCFARRKDIFTLVVAECIGGQGEFIDDIINGVWLICEESTWVVPAHNNHGNKWGKSNELVNIEEPIYIDLFAAETGSMVTWLYYFLGDAIGERSPLAKRRIELEMDRRIIQPYLEHDDFGYMGLDHTDPVNNWNPWINSNILVAMLVFANDTDRARGIEKTIRSINRFIAFYEEDGGCDEGPSYFGVAGASLLDFIEELVCINPEAGELYSEKLIRNMAAYIYKVYIGKSYYVNFADAPPRVPLVPAALLGRVGKKVGDDTLVTFAAYLMKNEFVVKQYASHNWNLFRYLSNIFCELPQGEFVAPLFSYFPGIQVLTARDAEDLSGLFFAAKGGNNGESHNHNDIGNFVLYRDGFPVLIDAGVEQYTKKTFSPERYSIWTMQSGYHNTVTVNGQMQIPGRAFGATDVTCDIKGDTATFGMEIRGAYPPEAEIKSFRRAFRFTRGGGLVIKDAYDLSTVHATSALTLSFLCFNEPTVSGGTADLGRGVQLRFDEGVFSANVEVIALTDEKLLNDWETDKLYRFVLTRLSDAPSGEYALEFVAR